MKASAGVNRDVARRLQEQGLTLDQGVRQLILAVASDPQGVTAKSIRERVPCFVTDAELGVLVRSLCEQDQLRCLVQKDAGSLRLGFFTMQPDEPS